MKFFVVIVLTIAAVTAEAPSGPVFIARYSTAQRQQAPVIPYPVVGSQPQVQVFSRQQVVPQTFYNQPQATTPEPQRNGTERDLSESTTEPQSEQVHNQRGKKNQNEKFTNGAISQPDEQGVYYLYHPTGLLQRVAYATSNDVAKMAYVAQLKYQNVDPIKDPIYTYDPETYVLQQVQL